MASTWSKFLAPCVVSTGGWGFVYSTTGGGPYTATIPAATYDTYLHMLSTLSGLVDADTGVNTCTINVTQYGKTSVQVDSVKLLVDFSSSADALMSTMGFDETETVGTVSTVTANHVHQWAWYPGLLSMPATGGVGLEDDSGSEPQETNVGTVSGSGYGRGVGPARDVYRRTVRFGAIKTSEYNDQNRGAIALKARWKNSVVWWYFDRSDGNVASYGTQVDPGYPSFDEDEDGDYIKVYFNQRGGVVFTRSTQTPRWRTVAVNFNVEPK